MYCRCVLLLCAGAAAFQQLRPTRNLQKTRRPATIAPEEVAADESSIIIDEEKMLAASTFPLKPDELIALSKQFLESRGGFGADEALLADSFEFVGPVVGPLSKSAFVNAIGSVDIDKAFPDFQGQFYGFFVDPYDLNRVWYHRCVEINRWFGTSRPNFEML